jgi:hypothetical protein
VRAYYPLGFKALEIPDIARDIPGITILKKLPPMLAPVFAIGERNREELPLDPEPRLRLGNSPPSCEYTPRPVLIALRLFRKLEL